jgi:GTP cyclohydrolase IA
MPVDYKRLVHAASEILLAIGEDVDREGLNDTPRRFADWWRGFIDHKEENADTLFESTSTDQMVVVSGIKVWSLCEHHLLPFSCDITIGYIATEKILGLSKFARIANIYAHKLQVQERLTHEIADHISQVCETKDVAVIAKGQHLCMMARGAKSDAIMNTSVMRGRFLDNQPTREEFFSLSSRVR